MMSYTCDKMNPMRPMLATKGSSVPPGGEWLHEVKWDGVRLLVEVRDGAVRLWTRNENEVGVAYPEVLGLSGLGHDALLDGEVVALADGVPRFSAIADRMHVRSATRAEQLARVNPVTLMVFDLLLLDGDNLMGRPLSERRDRLVQLDVNGPSWQTPATYDDGRMLLDATEQQGLEGVVSKRRGSIYVPGRRSADWLKFPHRPTRSYVIGGWRLETDSASRIGAVLVGEPTPQGLSYRGRVGSGIAGRDGQRLLEVLAPHHADASPFCDEVPRVDARGTTWVRPEVVVDVAVLGVTPGGRLRQPSYRGVRPDLAPGDL